MMKDKEYFYREDYKTYKKKFLQICNHCEFNVQKFGSLIIKPYICQIKIEKI